MATYYPPIPRDKRRSGPPPDPRKRLKRRNRAVLRMEVEHYHQTLEYLKHFDESIGGIQAYDYAKDRVQSQPDYTPTEREAILRALPVMEESRKRIKAIEYALGQLTDEQREYVKQRYWEQKKHFNDIARSLYVSPETLWKWDYKFITMIGKKLSWEV